MRRTLFVGLGGTGLKVINEVKNHFASKYKEIPHEIQFLGIDADLQALRNTLLNPSELCNLDICHPIGQLRVYKNRCDIDIPSKNETLIQCITECGTGQCRSNGHFLYFCDSLHNESVKRAISQKRNNMLCLPVSDKHQSKYIDIHLCFSLCGGFGSGCIIEIAKLIRKVIPQSNIICYAFSQQLYKGLPVNWNVRSNEYAALLEMDYECHKTAGEPNTRKLFDTFFYVGAQTYSAYGRFANYVLDLSDVIHDTAYAMIIAASSNSCAINDDLRTAELSGQYDVGLQSTKKAWVSSFGISKIKFNSNRNIDGMSEEELDSVVKSLIKRSRPLMDVNNCGLCVLMSSFNYLFIPKTICDVDNRLLDALKEHDPFMCIVYTDNVDYLTLYQQIGVIPPMFISGVSSGINGFVDAASCEDSFAKMIKNKQFSPFSKESYEDIFIGGFSLRSSDV